MSPPKVLARERATHTSIEAICAGAVPVDIVLAYYQTVVRRGLRMLLERVGDFTVVAETADVEGARRCVGVHDPDVLVLDLDQPAGSAIAAIGLLVEEFPATRLVVMSSRREPDFVRAAIAAGAAGYVPSAATAGDLTRAIRRAASGAPPLTRDLDPGPYAQAPSSGPCDLSPREVEVLQMIAMGHTNPEIARRLDLSVRTVETHRSRIRHKLKRPTRAELVEYVFAKGMLGPRSRRRPDALAPTSRPDDRP